MPFTRHQNCLDKSLLTTQKHAVWIIFNVNKGSHARPLFQELNTLNIYQIYLLKVLIFMYRIKTSISPNIFFTYFQLINHVYETRYSKHNLKQSDTFSKYLKFSISYQGQKYGITHHGSKNIVSAIFFKWRIKEKLLSNENELYYY